MPRDEVRRAYAARADEYAALFGSAAQHPAADQALVGSWSKEVTGPVVDAGCGPGHWTALLHEHGLTVEGVDLTPEFVALARQRFPHVTYRVGELGDLGVPDGALGGILAWYSVIHTPPEDVPAQLAEFARCLRPGGSLLIGFCEGPALERFDHAVVPAWFWPVEAMRQRLAGVGFEVLETHTRQDPGARPHAALVAVRAGGAPSGALAPGPAIGNRSAPGLGPVGEEDLFDRQAEQPRDGERER